MVNTLEKTKSNIRITKALLLILTTMLATTTIAFSSKPIASAATGPRIYLDSSNNAFNTTKTRIGDTFNVTVLAENVPADPGMAAWSVMLEFNDNILNVTRWFEPASSQYIFDGKTTNPQPVPPDPSYAHLGPGRGRVWPAASLFPTPPTQTPSSGSGKLCILEFSITATPPAGGELSCALHINVIDTTLLDPDIGDIPDITKEDGSYTFTYTAAVPPHLAVDPLFTRFSPYQNVTGMTFNVSVLAKAVDSSMDINSVSFSLAYNQTILATEQSNVTLDNLWSGPNSTTVADGMVNVTAANPTATPSGTVSITIIQFTIVQQDQSPPDTLGTYTPTSLNLVYARFQSGSGEIAADPSENGTVNIYSYYSAQTPLSFDPAASNIRVVNGTAYDFNLTIGDIFDLNMIQITIFYDPTAINCTDVEVGSALDSYVPEVLVNGTLNGFFVNRTAGYVLIKCTQVTAPIPLISGELFTVRFRGLDDATTSLNFSEPYGYENGTLLLDSLGTIIPVQYRHRGIHAEFSYTPAQPTVSDVVNFRDKSSSSDGYITSWLWNFSDGLISTSQNLNHTFALKGGYTVSLTVVDNNTDTSSITKTVTVFNAPPTVNFTYTPVNPHPNDNIQFTDNSVDPENKTLSSWFWNFGDGTNSTEQSPSHQYGSTGNYQVALTVADEENLTGSISATISVTEPTGLEIPLWAYVLIVIVIIAVIAAVVTIMRRRKTTVPT